MSRITFTAQRRGVWSSYSRDRTLTFLRSRTAPMEGQARSDFAFQIVFVLCSSGRKAILGEFESSKGSRRTQDAVLKHAPLRINKRRRDLKVKNVRRSKDAVQ